MFGPRAVTGFAADTQFTVAVLDRPAMLAELLVILQDTVAGCVAGAAVGVPVVGVAVVFPLAGVAVELLVEELHASGLVVHYQKTLLPARANYILNVIQGELRLRDVPRGGAFSGTVAGPLLYNLFENPRFFGSHHLAVPGVFPAFVLFGVTALTLLGAGKFPFGVGGPGQGGQTQNQGTGCSGRNNMIPHRVSPFSCEPAECPVIYRTFTSVRCL